MREGEYEKAIFIVKYILLHIIAQKSPGFPNQLSRIVACSDEALAIFLKSFLRSISLDLDVLWKWMYIQFFQLNGSNIVSRKADQIQRQWLLFSVPNLETTALAPKRLTYSRGNSLIIARAGNLNIRRERNT